MLVWVQVLLAAVALACAYCARRDQHRARAALEASEAVAARLEAAPGDAYRTPAALLPVVRDPVYCVDCRFSMVDPYGYSACWAMPDEGSYLRLGSSRTNANHDCAHWQKKAEEKK